MSLTCRHTCCREVLLPTVPGEPSFQQRQEFTLIQPQSWGKHRGPECCPLSLSGRLRQAGGLSWTQGGCRYK